MTSRLMLGIAFVIGASACHTWSRVGTPDEAIARAEKGTVRVTKKDSSAVLIQAPTIVQDTLVGTSVDPKHVRVEIPMSEVSAVETQEVSLGRTAGAGYLTVLGALGVALLAISVGMLAAK